MEVAKLNAAKAAIQYLPRNATIGVGTGTTVNFFIEELAKHRQRIEGAVASSQQTARWLQDHRIPIIDANAVSELPIYIDGADSFNESRQLIKGAGGAMTREKILASQATKFICIVDEPKTKQDFSRGLVAIEVLEMARSFVAREITRLGGSPSYRANFVTDNGNIILDVANLPLEQPQQLERELQLIPGVVGNGIFATRPADMIIIGNKNGSTEL